MPGGVFCISQKLIIVIHKLRAINWKPTATVNTVCVSLARLLTGQFLLKWLVVLSSKSAVVLLVNFLCVSMECND